MPLPVPRDRLEHMFEAATIAVELQSELAGLRADGRDRPLGELVDLVGACQSVINQAAAVQTLAMAHVAAIEDVALEDGTVVEQHRGLGHQRLDAPALVSEQLGVSDASASSRMAGAVDLVTRVPGALAVMGEGRLDEYRARIVAEELREATAEVCAEVVAMIEDTLGTEPPAALRRRVRRALEAVDADLLRAKAARARSARSLCRLPGDEPGVDTWMGSFPTEQSRSGWAVLDGLARQYVRDGKALGLEQARADALMDLIHARATGTFVVQLAIPADRLTPATQPTSAAGQARMRYPAAGLDAQGAAAVVAQSRAPGDVPVADDMDVADDMGVADVADDVDEELVTVVGLGMPGTTAVRRSWLTTLTADAAGADSGGGATDMGPAARTEVVACHASTGALLDVGADPLGRTSPARATGSAYRPPHVLLDLVRARDGRCRFPGCTVNARFCDLDHVIPWPLGPTSAPNLMCLCRRHHRIKQSIRWQVRIDPDATVVWTDPTGRRRTTQPLDFLQLDPPEHRAVRTRAIEHSPSSPRSPETPGMSGSPAGLPTDSAEALWSAWEEELDHELTRAARHVERRHAHRSDCGRALRCAELTFGLDQYRLDPAFADPGPRRSRHGAAACGTDPPF